MHTLLKFTAITLLMFPLLASPAFAAAKVPSDAELEKLVRESLLGFNKAVQANDFTGFHKEISKLWQDQITPAKLGEIFKTFVEQKIDLAFITESKAVFPKRATIDGDGVLIAEGNYPTTPNKVDFRLKYIQEKNAWKLIGVKVNVLPAGAADAKMPEEKELRALVMDSLDDFNDALQAKSFVAFYRQVSALWQKQTTPEKLQGNFQSFIDKEVDLSPVLKLEPRYDEPPAINEDGLLEVKGSFATRTDKVGFQLAYLFEGDAWKLVKINVKIGASDGEESE